MSTQVVRGRASAGQLLGSVCRARTSVWTGCAQILATWIERSNQRKMLRDIAWEGRMLKDIGLTREEALREADKPFWR